MRGPTAVVSSSPGGQPVERLRARLAEPAAGLHRCSSWARAGRREVRDRGPRAPRAARGGRLGRAVVGRLGGDRRRHLHRAAGAARPGARSPHPSSRCRLGRPPVRGNALRGPVPRSSARAARRAPPAPRDGRHPADRRDRPRRLRAARPAAPEGRRAVRGDPPPGDARGRGAGDRGRMGGRAGRRDRRGDASRGGRLRRALPAGARRSGQPAAPARHERPARRAGGGERGDADARDRGARRRVRGCRSRCSTRRAARRSTRCASFLAARVLGQPEAVDCLVERIALVKAGLTDPRPAARRLPVRRPDRDRQDGDRQGARRVPLRLGSRGSSGST